MHYLIAIIYFEQIEDEKKDLNPLMEANKKIEFFKQIPQFGLCDRFKI